MGSQALLATIRRGGQALHAGHRNCQRAEPHDATGYVDVGDQAAHAAEQEAIARRIQRIVERGLKFGRMGRSENLLQKNSQCDMIADRAGNNGRSHAAFAAVPDRVWLP